MKDKYKIRKNIQTLLGQAVSYVSWTNNKIIVKFKYNYTYPVPINNRCTIDYYNNKKITTYSTNIQYSILQIISFQFMFAGYLKIQYQTQP